MSSITRQGDRLIQKAGNDVEELGHVDFDQKTNTYVLWLKDTCGVLGPNDGYIRGDEFASKEVAKNKTLSSPSALIMHHIWMRRSTKSQAMRALNDNWEDIFTSIKQKTHVNKEVVIDKISKYFDKIPIDKIKEWSNGILNKLIMSKLNNLIERLLSDM